MNINVSPTQKMREPFREHTNYFLRCSLVCPRVTLNPIQHDLFANLFNMRGAIWPPCLKSLENVHWA